MLHARLVGAMSGATIGAAVGALSGGRRGVVAAAAAVGGAIGVACGAAAATVEPEPQVRTFADVARDDAEFRAAADKETVDYAAEADVLRSFFLGSRRERVQSACEAIDAVARLEAAREIFRPWATATPDVIGAAIQTVVEDLDAAHLRPTGIAKRLESGVNAACFGLFTLLAHAAFDAE